MTTPSPMRLNLLRAGYLLLVVGLGLTVWPSILDMGKSWELMHGVVVAMLGAMSLLAVLGLRYPLQMLPLLFFEVAWKAIWLLRVALPLWTAHRLDAGASETAFECSLAVVFLVVIPWPYVFENYIRKGGDPWRVRTEPQRRA
ncbi:MAG: hypothetical protein KGL97_19665 [Alphaproteobacteria bacterium]|nr:hypothetical protein [Alphaproteobacteria bacterium]